ncbi:hypothetical protein Ddye_009205 [Dipteronia dyeriana]|uniref:CCHC-type domain-containing protein n=1 Tax=Dipteronia dyeriana TaxID=168575 RepID=A0AAD9XBY0_9ROSI|nr:hypothetical protein Ddye_009205 [Dipteronia dyeriana]
MTTLKNNKINWKLWHLARVANHAGFNQVLASIRKESLQAANLLLSEPVEKWARHAFESSLKADHICNNMSECFNSWIREDKRQTCTSIVGEFEKEIMVRLCEKWAKVEKLSDLITPYARENFTKNEKEARNLQVIHGRGQWWPIVQSEIIEPPVKKTKARIINKNKIRALDELRAPNATFHERCSKCGEPGHNRATCRFELVKKKKKNAAAFVCFNTLFSISLHAFLSVNPLF